MNTMAIRLVSLLKKTNTFQLKLGPFYPVQKFNRLLIITEHSNIFLPSF